MAECKHLHSDKPDPDRTEMIAVKDFEIARLKLELEEIKSGVRMEPWIKIRQELQDEMSHRIDMAHRWVKADAERKQAEKRLNEALAECAAKDEALEHAKIWISKQKPHTPNSEQATNSIVGVDVLCEIEKVIAPNSGRPLLDRVKALEKVMEVVGQFIDELADFTSWEDRPDLGLKFKAAKDSLWSWRGGKGV